MNGDQKAQTGEKWHKTASTLVSQFGSVESHSNFRLDLAADYPEFPSLPERCKKILDILGVRFPDERAGCLRLDQGKPGSDITLCRVFRVQCYFEWVGVRKYNRMLIGLDR